MLGSLSPPFTPSAVLTQWPSLPPVSLGVKRRVTATGRPVHFAEAAVLVTVACAAHDAARRRHCRVRRKLQERKEFEDFGCPGLYRLKQPVRPGRVSPERLVPKSILRPRYLKPGTRMDPRTGLPAHPFTHFIERKTTAQIAAMREACALAREALEVAGRAVHPGVSTDEIDAVTHDFIISRGAYPSPLGYAGYPKSVSTAVNDIIAHGIPDDRLLQDGDILNIDVTVFVGGYHGDTSSMFLVGKDHDKSALQLCRAAKHATAAGIEVCGPGVDLRAIGPTIEAVANSACCHVSPLFVGHGIGSYFHGAPEIIPHENDMDQGEMMPGMVFTVEPILIEDFDESFETWDDGWTVQTLTGARSAQFEHTILITDDGHEILTGPSLAYEEFGV
mmetsp:Transcript_51694/g.102807  ORF Transcript_51694/g.102807 Transcript_51694/m.102807 type:complete len:390 (+) Transcript_51694:23-1192(+)|eukprot:CAMPEP_0172756082 /NCGR_PEP_ID=MMETSP1074-20121228/161117_1 /TAXON_ID=2916 /ORGANISM="Ceratium fusus, Strain PA161109" /LENGTH=389 /DNA_ID=CAMNT_0013589289 /DNA_START=24 /DNA_END=1193 /DNA_ORIENTATION=+